MSPTREERGEPAGRDEVVDEKGPDNRDQGGAILVVGPAWVGDLMMAQTLFAALARHDPTVPIDVMAPPWGAEILARMPEVRHWIDAPFPRRHLALAARWRCGVALRGRYQVAYVLPNSWKSALVPFFAGVPRRVGYRGEWRHGLLSDVRRLPAGLKRKTATAYAGLAGEARPIAPHLSVDRVRQGTLLLGHGLRHGAFVALMPGAAFGASKQWPVRHYAALARALSARGLAVALFGSAADAGTGAAIAALAPDVVDLCGQTGLGDVIDLLAAARATVSNDSGLMHVAAAVGTPVVALYGSTSPDDTPPLTARAAPLTLGLSCSPCHERTCRLGHHDCLERMGVDQVMAALDRVMMGTA